MNKEWTVWQTYHEAGQKDRFGLVGDEHHVPFFVGAGVDEPNINGMNRCLSEIVTMWYVWKNEKRSDLVGFETYRRRLDLSSLPKDGEVFVYNMYDFSPKTVYEHYVAVFGKKTIDAAIDEISDRYGADSEYIGNIKGSPILVANCTFMMSYDTFEGLCEFLFPVLEGTAKRLGFEFSEDGFYAALGRNMYENNGVYHRMFGHIGERLISSYVLSRFSMDKIVKRHTEILA